MSATPWLANWHSVPRQDVPAALALIAERTKPGRLYRCEIVHEPACPCAGDRAPLSACTCELVGVRAAELQ